MIFDGILDFKFKYSNFLQIVKPFGKFQIKSAFEYFI